MADKVWQYIGDGLGIPGLPHVIGEEQARVDGILELLKAAIKAGKYEPVKPEEVKKNG